MEYLGTNKAKNIDKQSYRMGSDNLKYRVHTE